MKTPKGTVLRLDKLKGKDYLPVQQRVLWFREEHPDWTITTEFVILNEKAALAKATIVDDKGVTIATAHKYEDLEGFAFFHEKAETGAIGRALALCSYGTQFAIELDEGDHVVDAPVQPRVTKPVSKPNDPGDWVVNSGKEHYGKKLKDIPDAELMRCIQLIKDHAHSNKKEISQPQQQFIEKAEAYLSKKFDDEVSK